MFALLVLFAISHYSCSNKRSGKSRILVFTKTAGFVHSSIPNGVAAVNKLGAENNFDVDTTSNANMFTDSILKKYSAIIFLNTTGDVLNYSRKLLLKDIFSPVAALLAYMLLLIQNTTGDGMVSWLGLISMVTQKINRQNL